jgi:hypothetical protein
VLRALAPGLADVIEVVQADSDDLARDQRREKALDLDRVPALQVPWVGSRAHELEEIADAWQQEVPSVFLDDRPSHAVDERRG